MLNKTINSIPPIILILGVLFNLIQHLAVVSITNSSTYFGSLTRNSQRYGRPGDLYNPHYYYQAIQVNVSADGTYVFKSNSSIDIYGYFYSDFVDPADPNENLIASDRDSSGFGQFRITVDLKFEQIYVLLVTTYSPHVIGDFFLNAFGEGLIDFVSVMPSTSRPFSTTTQYIPPPRVTTYDGYVSSQSPILFSPSDLPWGYHHYEVVQITTHNSGEYSFNSSCDIYIVGYFYNDTFDPDNLLDHMVQSDRSSYGVLRFSISMIPGRSYFLVITTYYPDVSLAFTIYSYGRSLISMTSFTASTHRPVPTTTTLAMVSANYSGYFLLTSPVFFPFDSNYQYWYYQAIRLVVSTTNTYTFFGISKEISLRAFLYADSFDPSNPSENLYDYYKYQITHTFNFADNLQKNTTYILVLAAYYPDSIGTFSLTVSGLQSIELSPMTPSTHRPISTTVVTPSTSPMIYSGSLSITNPKFSPSNLPFGNYYYQAYRMENVAWETYRFLSSSDMHTCGYLYKDYFDSSDISKNFITFNNGSYDPGQFEIIASLKSSQEYILIVTTLYPNVAGAFSLLVFGSKSLHLIPFVPPPPTTTHTIDVTTTTTAAPTIPQLSTQEILGISAGCLMSLAVIIAVIYKYRKYRTNENLYRPTKINQSSTSITKWDDRNAKQLPHNYQTFAPVVKG